MCVAALPLCVHHYFLHILKPGGYVGTSFYLKCSCPTIIAVSHYNYDSLPQKGKCVIQTTFSKPAPLQSTPPYPAVLNFQSVLDHLPQLKPEPCAQNWGAAVHSWLFPPGKHLTFFYVAICSHIAIWNSLSSLGLVRQALDPLFSSPECCLQCRYLIVDSFWSLKWLNDNDK